MLSRKEFLLKKSKGKRIVNDKLLELRKILNISLDLSCFIQLEESLLEIDRFYESFSDAKQTNRLISITFKKNEMLKVSDWLKKKLLNRVDSFVKIINKDSVYIGVFLLPTNVVKEKWIDLLSFDGDTLNVSLSDFNVMIDLFDYEGCFYFECNVWSLEENHHLENE